MAFKRSTGWSGRAGLALATMIAALAVPSSGEPRSRSLAAACAAFDLHLLTLVEDHGATGETDPRELLEAMLAVADARTACREGQERALQIYGAIELRPVAVSPFHRVLLR